MILSHQTGAVVIPDPDSLNDNQNNGDVNGDTKVGTAYPFLLLTNSPRANAMGGCTINWIDEQSGIHNPGALGLFHLDKVFALAAPSNTDWMPNLVSDMQLTSYCASAGISYRLAFGGNGPHNAAFGFSYANMTMDYGSFGVTDYEGHITGIYSMKDIMRNYSAGIGIDYFCRLGIGMTYSTVIEKITGSQGPPAAGDGHTFNFGAVIEMPLFKFLPEPINPNRADRPICFELTPSVALVAINPGNGIAKFASNTYLLPNITRYGMSVTGSFGIRNAKFAAATFVDERGQHMGRTLEWRDGWEVAVFDIFSVRGGRFREEPFPEQDRQTHGYGLKLDGIIDWIRHFNPHAFANGLGRYLADHLSISFDHASYGNVNDIPAFDNTEFLNVSASF